MSLFFDYGIKDIQQKYSSGELSKNDLKNEVIKSYDQYQNLYYPWVHFGREQIESYYLQDFNEKNLRSLDLIPVAIKDIFNTNNYPTEMGSELWSGFTPGNNARVIDTLISSGACIAGKTVTAEFAVHALNQTLNPYDIRRTPGTSSSGSAVAVALGMVPLALGTQTAGSIIRPASFCGIWGYKPTFGLIPRTGMLKTTDSLDTVGLLSTRLDNIVVAIEAIRVKGKNYPMVHSLYEKKSFNKDHNRPKVAFVKTHTWDNFDVEVKNNITSFVSDLNRSNLCDVYEVDIPEIFKESHLLHSVIYDKSLAYYFSTEYQDFEKISPAMRQMIERGRAINIEAFYAALNKQDLLIKELDIFFDNYDFIVTGATASVAPVRHNFEKDDPSLMWTLAQAPSVSAPLFKNSEELPFGIQFVAKRFDDKNLLGFLSNLVDANLLKNASPIVKN